MRTTEISTLGLTLRGRAVKLSISWLVASLLATQAIPGEAKASDLHIDWWVVASGGVDGSGTRYQRQATVGQRASGADSAWAVDITLSLFFIPEAYGTVSSFAMSYPTEGDAESIEGDQSRPEESRYSLPHTVFNRSDSLAVQVVQLAGANRQLQMEVADLRSLVDGLLAGTRTEER